MKIKHASLSDLENIAKAEAICFPGKEAAAREVLRARLRAYPNHFWLLYEGDHLIGYADGPVTDLPDPTENLYKRAETHRENGVWQMLFGLGIMPAYRHRGFASTLLEYVIDAAKKQGRRGVVLVCGYSQIGIFEKFGFKIEKTCSSSPGGVCASMRLQF